MWASIKRFFSTQEQLQSTQPISALRGRRCHGCRERIAVFRCVDAELCDPCVEEYKRDGHIHHHAPVPITNPFDELHKAQAALHKAEDERHALEVALHRMERERLIESEELERLRAHESDAKERLEKLHAQNIAATARIRKESIQPKPERFKPLSTEQQSAERHREREHLGYGHNVW